MFRKRFHCAAKMAGARGASRRDGNVLYGEGFVLVSAKQMTGIRPMIEPKWLGRGKSARIISGDG